MYMYALVHHATVIAYLHMYMYIAKLTVIVCLVLCKTVDLYVMFCVKICIGCGFNYTIYRKTKQAMTLVFVIQLPYILIDV